MGGGDDAFLEGRSGAPSARRMPIYATFKAKSLPGPAVRWFVERLRALAASPARAATWGRSIRGGSGICRTLFS
jgi:hypothetical protein